jgi:hypothetical protein
MCRMSEPAPQGTGRRHRAPDPPTAFGVSFRAGAMIAAATVAVVALAALRHGAPSQQETAQQAIGPQPVRFRASPSMPPRGPLPSPAVANRAQNQVIGYLPVAGGAPGKETALLEVDTILDWYCPESTRRDSELRPEDDWARAEVVTHPHPGVVISLNLQWTGTSYRWEGPYDRLEACW